ncbi:olfactory receptor 2B6-like [Engraulis encrasicolus]|uniref:olfactory receptor 2B6-like n=1 Tax=Engraulis encrasicolus TaxID=184585 RepID=UPI002FCF6ED0
MALNISGPMTTIYTLPSFPFPPSARLPILLISTLTYMVIIFCNIMIVVTVAKTRKLHQPMYLLLANLPMCDMWGATAFFPQMISSMMFDPRVITDWVCRLQALVAHMYGASSVFTLTAMAFDRYVAICKPLSYNTIMTNSNVAKIICFIWLSDFTCLLILILMTLRLKNCSTEIVDMFCSNPALMQMACGGVGANNYYGMFTIAFFQGTSLCIILFTYAQILFTCFFKKQSEAKRKAFQTCGSHIVVFLFFQLNSFVYFLTHRVPNAPIAG